MQPSVRARLNANPRRPLPGQSVSLRKGDAAATHVQKSPSHHSSDSSSLAAHRNSSGETSNVDVWFDKSNKRVGGKIPSLNESDSPFNFDRNHGDASPQGPIMTPSPLRVPLHPNIPTNNSSGSSSEEYRSVIDDLTIENKTLKKRLRRYERAHDLHLQKDRLFEVKIHGLPVEKKRELEDMLQRFASSLNHESPSSALARSASSVYPNASKLAGKQTSSLTSTRIADSGYGSLTTSGNNPVSHSSRQRSHASNVLDKSREMDRNIHSYLHDIPEGLVPKHASALTEKSKKKLVVRRLEQIFGGGRRSDPSLQQHPLQQQAVSHSAARADRRDLEASGQSVKAEGIREARIMDGETEDPMDPPLEREGHDQSIDKASASVRRDQPKEEQDQASSMSPPEEQRPTRPMDLDPHRAQNPSENMEYIRHLGFLDSGEGSTIPSMDDQEWIYLNLLVGMAQLHTINVTTDFVKKALAEYSSKIELSSDGRKVRWRQNEGAMLSSDSSPDVHHDSSSAAATDEDQAGIKRPRPSYLEMPGSGANHKPKKQAVETGSKDRFAYTPLFSHQDSSDDESDVSIGEDGYFPTGTLGDNGNPALGGSKARRSSSSNTPGSLIFYNNANFCTDLSGDKSARPRQSPPLRRQPVTSVPLGSAREVSRKRPSSVYSSVKDSGSSVFDVSELSSSLDLGSRSDVDLHFPSDILPSGKRVTFVDPAESMPLEASGVGGVRPDDNVTITVMRQREAASPTSSPKARTRSSKLGSMLSHKRPSASSRIVERVISTHEKKVDPSPLPPASLHFTDANSDSDSDASSEDSSADLRDRIAGKAGLSSQKVDVALSQRSAGSFGSDEPMDDQSSDDGDGDEDEDEEDSEEDQSLDFLATARAADPAAVRAKEREYDAEMAERLAEEIPAGSSAATAGGRGGSGFTSPNLLVEPDDVDMEGSISS